MTSEIAHARSTDPQTSFDAARSVGDTTPKQLAVLRLFNTAGDPDRRLSDEQVAEAYPKQAVSPQQSASGLRTRRGECVTKGLLKNSGWIGKTSAGRKTIKWSITEAGLKLLSS